MNNLLLKIIIGVECGAVLLLGGWIGVSCVLNQTPSIKDSDYGNFDGAVAFSYTLDNLIYQNYDVTSRGAINEALTDYYVSDYPHGVGLTLIKYGFFEDYGSFDVVTSRGKFDKFVIKENKADGTISFIVDDYEKEYVLDYEKYAESEDDWD